MTTVTRVGMIATRSHPEIPVSLELTATRSVTRFVAVPGVYRHWSLLCGYRGTVGGTPVEGLCTFEYARGVGTQSLPRPLRRHSNLSQLFQLSRRHHHPRLPDFERNTRPLHTTVRTTPLTFFRKTLK